MTMPEWQDGSFFDTKDDSSMVTREQNWIRLEVLGHPLVKKYAWACPNDRALVSDE